MTLLSPRDRGRLLVLIALAGTVAFLPARVLCFVLPALSPFVCISVLLTTREIGWSILCAVPMLALVFWRRRAFCSSLCPTGLLLDTCSRARRADAGTACARVPAFGYWAALITIGGALLACPLFLVLDPIGILAGAMGGVQPPVLPPRLVCVVGLASLAVLSLFVPRLWCTRLCPLGGMQEVLADLAGVFARSARQKHPAPSHSRLARRAFFGVGAGIAISGLGMRLPVRGHNEVHFRPPGAVDEPILKALCIRCNNCARTCPTNIIKPSLSLSDPAGLLTPTLSFDTGHCIDSCNRCGQDCPTGAIRALPLERKNEAGIGMAAIDQKACLLWTERECVACVTTCKREAIREDFSQETYRLAVNVDEAKCNGCGACLRVCPGHAIVLKTIR